MTARRFMGAFSVDDPYKANVVLMASLDGNLTDKAGVQSLYTVGTNVSFDTTDPRIGTHCARTTDATANISHIHADYSPSIDLIGSSWTMEAHVKCSTIKAANSIILQTGGTSLSWVGDQRPHVSMELVMGSTAEKARLAMRVANSSGGVSQVISAGEIDSPSGGVWIYAACCFDVSTNTASVFLDGEMTSATISNIARPVGNPRLGIFHGPAASTTANAQSFSGRIDEVRITKGVARYSSSIPIPTKPFWS